MRAFLLSLPLLAACGLLDDGKHGDGDDDTGGACDLDELVPVYEDADGDGFGDPASEKMGCGPGPEETSDGTDCDDSDAAIHPGATEDDCTDPTDYNCDGSSAYEDTDGDGSPACLDCDDADAEVSPLAQEICDDLDVDEDCDGLSDDADDDATDPTTWGRDADGDGYYGDGITLAQCEAPEGYAAASGDCDDLDGGSSPGSTEVCDAFDVDEDCDGLTDDSDTSVDPSSWTTFYSDRDGDSYGDVSRTVNQCELPEGYVEDASDCDDEDATVSPGANEACDGGDVDEDCDGLVDDDDSSVSGETTWYADSDGDGYGGATTSRACSMPSGHVADAGDCDDGDAAISPAAVEVCDASDTDEDCDGAADDSDPSATGTSTFYADADGDGYGDLGAPRSLCDSTAAVVSDATDCDDAASDSYPGAAEVCGDGVDQDCSGADEACPNYSGTYGVDSGYDTKLHGVSANDRFGDDIVAGDFDGDGAGDLVVTALTNVYSTEESTVYGYYGPFGAGEASATTDDDFLYYNTSASYDGEFGGRLYNIGDVDGDGADDLLIGLQNSSPWTSWLYLGGDTGVSDYAAKDDGSFSCSSAAAAGDVDATAGTDEWICGYSADNGNTGAAYVYSGTSASVVATLRGESASDYAGKSVAGGGDVDGDGYDDVWVGAYMDDDTATEAGAVYLVYAPVSGTASLSSADAKIRGDAYQDYLGNNLDMPGDVDGDGYDDLLASAHLDDTASTNAGAIYLFTHPTTGGAAAQADAIIRGEDASDQLGWNIQSGDFDGDGEVDLLLGSHFNDDGASEAGSVWLVYGPLSGTMTLSSADAEWLGSEASDYIGYSTAAIPDSDGDGADELGLGSINGDGGGLSDPGAVWIWMGR